MMRTEELYYLPASELLKHIQAEKEQLIKEKIIKKSKPLPPITEEEKPYELPEDWTWVRLGKVIEFSNGYAFKSKDFLDSGIGVIRIGDIVNGTIDETNMVFLESSIVETISKDYLVYPNDLLIAMSGATTGKIGTNTTSKTFLLNQRVGKINPILVNRSFIKYLLELRTQEYLNMSLGSAIQNLSTEQIRHSIIPLPPLYIQDEIVQKLEQLSKTKESLLSHAESQLNYTKKMREALLQEAIHGALVPQDGNDEPASVLLEKVKTEKERLIKEKVIKKQKELPPITDEEKPYELPEGWEWVRFGDVVINRDGERKPLSSKQRENITKIYDYYGASGVIDKVDEYLFDKRLLLIGEDGANLITRSKPIAFFAEGKYWVNNHAHVLDSTDSMCIDYVEKYINAIDLKPYVTGTAQPKLNQEKLNSILIALPPLAEQERIVAKLDELIAHCEQLEAKAEEMKNYTTSLFEANLKEAFMPE